MDAQALIRVARGGAHRPPAVQAQAGPREGGGGACCRQGPHFLPPPLAATHRALLCLRGATADVKDGIMADGANWGYQALQPWQDAVVTRGEGLVEELRQRHAAKL